MKKFSLSVSVDRSAGVDTVVTSTGNFNKSEVQEATGVVQAAIEAEEDQGATYSGTAKVWDDEVAESTETITVEKVKKSTIMEFSGFMQTESTNSTPVDEVKVDTEKEAAAES